MMAARVDPELQAMLDGDPLRMIEAILLARGRLDDMLDSLPADVTVVHKYSLIGSASVTATAGTLRGVAATGSVKAIEPVRDVSHC